jgi:hypothetical protein
MARVWLRVAGLGDALVGGELVRVEQPWDDHAVDRHTGSFTSISAFAR